jgi:PAS domain S-box-containing protein
LADNSFTHLVVVGSSAGGIGALSGLVSSLPEDFEAPIVVAQHLDPNRESHLQEILARKSTVPVKTVTEHEPLQAGVVYVVPANWHVNITDSEIELSSEQLSGQPMPSINLLMETAAGVYEENLIAVVLSVTGTDGTEGARTVSQAGGTVIIQDPETADFGEMPRSLAPSTVDIVASLEEIGPVLKNLISGIAVRKEVPEEEGRELEHFLEELHRGRGVDFRSYKRPTIMRRLGRRMAATNSESIGEYSGYLEEHPEEYRQLIGTQQLATATRGVDEELINQLPVGVVVVARDYDIEAINTAARKMLSIPSVGAGQDFLHAEQEVPYAEVRRTIDEAFREGTVTQADEFAVEDAATGEPSHLRLTRYPRRSEIEGQSVMSVLVAIEDVTAGVRLRQLTEKNLRLEEANRDLGLLNEELQAAHEESLVNTEEAQAAAEEVETLNEELQATVEELNTTNDDLQARATELQELAQRREEERQLTEAARRRAEDLVEQLQSERSRLEAIVVNISDAVLAVDTDGQVLFSNQVFGETFGEHTGAEQNPLGSREVLDESGEELPSESTPASRAAGRESFAMRFAVRGQEGALRRFEARGRPIQGDGVTGGVLVIREVTNG